MAKEQYPIEELLDDISKGSSIITDSSYETSSYSEIDQDEEVKTVGLQKVYNFYFAAAQQLKNRYMVKNQDDRANGHAGKKEDEDIDLRFLDEEALNL